MENFWTHCLERFKKELSAQQFNTWIKPLRFEHDQNKIKILAPNKFVQQWVKDRFAQKIELLAKELLPDVTKVEFAIRAIKESILPKKEAVLSKALAISPPNNVTEAPSQETIKKSAGGTLKEVKASGLNPQFTFESFVTGKANQLACAAAMQVAENPGKAYNPLFIYGGVGLGKTHLIHAIGNHLKQIQPDAKIKYLHAERYVSDVVKAYENKAFDAFKKNYHSLDLLLIDDIQFFSKKNRTQEEFFYAFNALIENKKQIIITCDSYPKEIEGVDERLRTRFSWGLTVAIEPPELEMRVAILLKKAEENKMKISEEVAFFIAKQIRSNVRELEGALNRILAMSNFTKSAIDIHLAKDALKDLIAVRGRQVSVENIQKTVAEYFKIKISDMLSKKRSRNYSKPRQLAMALTRELTNLSFPEIGEAYGGRHHTTVMHACEEIEQLRLSNQSVAQDLGILKQVLKG
ncbi:MAG: chromosomal replication initiator protein DnaA, DNA-binding transcriptional dual regulator [Pseudomonadota bacterium]